MCIRDSILDDCLPVDKHPLRNALYTQCGFFAGSYDPVSYTHLDVYKRQT